MSPRYSRELAGPRIHVGRKMTSSQDQLSNWREQFTHAPASGGIFNTSKGFDLRIKSGLKRDFVDVVERMVENEVFIGSW